MERNCLAGRMVVHVRMILSLLIQIIERNRIVFDLGSICKANESREIMGWRESIPSTVRSVVCTDGETAGAGVCPAVRRLVEHDE